MSRKRLARRALRAVVATLLLSAGMTGITAIALFAPLWVTIVLCAVGCCYLMANELVESKRATYVN